MENFIRAQLGDAESNCGERTRTLKHLNETYLICSCIILIVLFTLFSEWSVLYVTIASFMIVVAMATLVWGMVCCCNR